MSKQLSWINSNGVEFPFSKEKKVRILKGMKGFYMPPISFTEEEVPFQAGSRLRQVKVQPREMDLPIKIDCFTPKELAMKIREVLRIFNPLKADGKFKSIAADGSQREISCRYVSGFEMDESSSMSGETWQKAVGVFRAFDPFWYDSSTQVHTFKINESPGLFFPILPLRLVSSTVFADVTVDNAGDVETWPEWIITGPGENIVMRNMSTDEVMSLDVSLDVGETLTIDTRSYHKTVTKSDGTNLFYTLSDDSSLWSLQEGNNSIQIQMGNATTDSNIQLTYRNRYWGP